VYYIIITQDCFSYHPKKGVLFTRRKYIVHLLFILKFNYLVNFIIRIYSQFGPLCSFVEPS